MALFIYNLIFVLLMPLVYVRQRIKALKQPEYSQRWHERLALKPQNVPAGGVLFHVASLGEAIAAAPLIHRFTALHPTVAVTLTCMTPTGSAYIQQTFGSSVNHCYLPFDIKGLQWLFLSRLKPRLIVLMETELWPNLLNCANKLGIRSMLINGRLSERSAKGYRRIPPITRSILQNLDYIGAQFEADSQRFQALGCPKHKIVVTGNVKFDVSLSKAQIELNNLWRQQWQINRPVWLAASTHQGEESQILKAHNELLQRVPNALLIIVPRHPQRFKEVLSLSAEQFICEQKSTINRGPNQGTQVVVGDTMGEMMQYISLANIVFMGGSLVEHGGHNPFEAACQKKPIISGKHVFNFSCSYHLLTSYGAIDMVIDSEGLFESLLSLLSEPCQQLLMGQNAFQCQQASRGATATTLLLLQQQFRIAGGAEFNALPLPLEDLEITSSPLS